MIEKQVEIPTVDGVADGYVLYPSEDGQFPAVLFYMDGIGVRPTLVELAKRIAERGYYVLLPNMFYRRGPAPLFDYQRYLAGENRDELRAQIIAMIRELNPDAIARDSAAYLDFLAAQPQVKAGQIAVTGYCMGGGAAIRTAGYHPERVLAAASFHGGNLANEDPNSPHLLADRITAELYIGHAKDDQSCPPEQIERLEQALTAAGVKFQSKMYDAHHGWTMPDTPAYNKAEADRAWGNLFDLLERTFPNASQP